MKDSITNQERSVLCCGGFHMDHILRCVQSFQNGTSNPVEVRHASGGVAGNIAGGLALLGHSVGLMSAVGDDPQGLGLVAEAAARGIDTSLICRRRDIPTASYWATLEPGGELIAGFADTRAYEKITTSSVSARWHQVEEWAWRIVDANLPVAIIETLLTNSAMTPVVGATVSTAKACRWQGLLHGLRLLVTNRAELATLVGEPMDELEQVFAGCEALLKRGLPALVVTLGYQGAVCYSAELTARWKPPKTRIVDVNGAGDAFLAGLAASLVHNLGMEHGMRQGLAMASLVAEHMGSVPPALDPGELKMRMTKVRVSPL